MKVSVKSVKQVKCPYCKQMMFYSNGKIWEHGTLGKNMGRCPGSLTKIKKDSK
jgi:hypothetical protein